MKRYYVDYASELSVSDDQIVVSLVCANKNSNDVEPEFQVVLPKSSFISMTTFFSVVKKQLEDASSESSTKEKKA